MKTLDVVVSILIGAAGVAVVSTASAAGVSPKTVSKADSCDTTDLSDLQSCCEDLFLQFTQSQNAFDAAIRDGRTADAEEYVGILQGLADDIARSNGGCDPSVWNG